MYQHIADLGGEDAIGLLHMGEVPVDVQMVCIHGGDGRNARVQLVEGAVELIGLSHHHRIVAHQQVGAVVARDASEEGGASFSALGEYMRHQSRGRGFPVSPGHRKAALTPGDFAQNPGAFHHPVAPVKGLAKLSQLRRDCRSVNHKSLLPVLGQEFGTVLIVHCNAFLLQLMRQFARGFVVAADLKSLELEVTGDGAHPYSAYSYEIYLFHFTNSYAQSTITLAASGRASAAAFFSIDSSLCGS